MAKREFKACIKLLCADGNIHTYDLNKSRFSIGSQADMDICFPELERTHCTITNEAGEWVLARCMEDAVIEFKHQSIDLKKLNDGDCLDLGPVQLCFYYDRQDTGTAVTLLNEEISKVGSWKASILKGPDKGKEYILRPGVYSIGRDFPGAVDQIGLTDPYISKHHATVKIDSDGIRIEDCGSKNGIKIGFRKRAVYQASGNFKIETGITHIAFSRCKNSSSDMSTRVIQRHVSLWRRVFRALCFFMAILGVLILLLFFYGDRSLF